MNFDGKSILFLDFETVYDTKAGFGLKEMSLTEYIRDSRFKAHGMAACWGGLETRWSNSDALPAVIAGIDWPNTIVVAHNVRFDGSILAWRYGVKPYAYFDTLALAKAVLGENVSGYSLGALAEYLGFKSKGTLKWDGVRDLTPQQEEEMAEYCKNDVEICRGIYERLIGQFPTSQLSAMDWTIRAFIEPRLSLDIKTLYEGVQNEKKRREEIIKASGVEKSVLASNKQFAEHLQKSGITVPTKISGRSGKSIPAFARTDEGLINLAYTAPSLFAARIASKANLLETRGESLLAVAKTGPFPFDVGFSGAVQTHRYSGGSGAGGNPQNFTRQSFLRDAVCAPSGYSLVVGDFAAIELRLLAWLAKEPKLMSKIINDEDIYADFASLKCGRKITKADKVERQFGKGAILGLGYNMGAKKFKLTIKSQTGIDISEEEAWATVNLYRATYFNVPRLWANAHDLLPLISTGAVGCIWFAPFIKVEKNKFVLPSGLKIQYPNLRQVEVSSFNSSGRPNLECEWVYDVYKKKYDKETKTLYGGKIVEQICQSLAGELTKSAIERAEKAGLRCVAQIHDEIIAVVPNNKAVESVDILKAVMEQSPSWMPFLRLKAEVGSGKSWGNAKA